MFAGRWPQLSCGVCWFSCTCRSFVCSSLVVPDSSHSHLCNPSFPAVIPHMANSFWYLAWCEASHNAARCSGCSPVERRVRHALSTWGVDAGPPLEGLASRKLRQMQPRSVYVEAGLHLRLQTAAYLGHGRRLFERRAELEIVVGIGCEGLVADLEIGLACFSGPAAGRALQAEPTFPAPAASRTPQPTTAAAHPQQTQYGPVEQA
jgi:hypothetical protein